MKIVFADAHGPVRGKAQQSPNLGLLYLASYLQEKMPEVSVTYVPQAYELSQHIEIIEEFEPDIYATSFTSYGAIVAFDSIHKLKERFPDLCIVCGGPHPSSAPRDVLEKTPADICVIGEGEATFTEIVEKGDRLFDELDSILGIAYLKDGVFHQTMPRPLIDDLDTIPYPNRTLVDDADYAGFGLQQAHPGTEVIITRGCPLRCVFCANPVFRVKGGALFRKRSPEAIAAEVEELYQQGYRELYLHSDELNVELQWSIDVCKALAALGHKDLYFQANLRVVPFSEELAYWLKQANFWLIRFGIESASERVLKGIKKQMSNKRTERTLQMVADQGIKIFGFFMMFQIWENKEGELQYETVEEVEGSLRYVWDLWRRGLLHYIAWGVAVPVQGAEMYDIAVRHRLITNDYYPDMPYSPVETLPDVSEKEFARIIRKGRMLQGAMAFRNGGINWQNVGGLMVKAKDLITGRQTK